MKDKKDRKPVLKLRYSNAIGLVHVELFDYERALFIHRHTLTDDDIYAALHKDKRKIFGKWYCNQELLLLDDDLGSILGYLFLYHANRINHLIEMGVKNLVQDYSKPVSDKLIGPVCPQDGRGCDEYDSTSCSSDCLLCERYPFMQNAKKGQPIDSPLQTNE